MRLGLRVFWSGAPGAPPLDIFGALHPLRPWCPRFETRRYSNVVCAHDDGVKAALRGLTLARAAGEFKQGAQAREGSRRVQGGSEGDASACRPAGRRRGRPFTADHSRPDLATGLARISAKRVTSVAAR